MNKELLLIALHFAVWLKDFTLKPRNPSKLLNDSLLKKKEKKCNDALQAFEAFNNNTCLVGFLKLTENFRNGQLFDNGIIY